MPRSYNSAVQAALDAGRISSRVLILLHLDSGLRGFHTGLGNFTFNGTNYVGAGSLIEIEGLKQTADLSSVQMIGRLTSIPNTDLTPDVLATIENEIYHQRLCSLSTAYFNADNGALLNVELEYEGYIDQILHTETIDGRACLEVHLESRFRDHQRSGYRLRSNLDQQRIDATDNGLKYVTKVEDEHVLFGKLPPAPATPAAAPKKKAGGILGFIGRIFG